MRLLKKDIIATVLVTVAVVLYVLWLADVTPPGMSSTRVTGMVILGLGFVASAIAVVPGFDQLVHGNKVYLAVTSLLGLVALIAGVVLLASASGTALGVVMGTMVVLWAIATAHHTLGARSEPAAAGHADTVTTVGRRR